MTFRDNHFGGFNARYTCFPTIVFYYPHCNFIILYLVIKNSLYVMEIIVIWIYSTGNRYSNLLSLVSFGSSEKWCLWTSLDWNSANMFSKFFSNNEQGAIWRNISISYWVDNWHWTLEWEHKIENYLLSEGCCYIEPWCHHHL
jgi:hypothetical protein